MRHKRTIEADTDSLNDGKYAIVHVRRHIIGLTPVTITKCVKIPVKNFFSDDENNDVNHGRGTHYLSFPRLVEREEDISSVCWSNESPNCSEKKL